MTMHCVFKFVSAASASLLFAGATLADSIHVSPSGDDGHPGTTAKPLRTIGKAVALAAEREGAQEIVIHEGVYAGEVTVAARENPPPLVFRAAKRADGSCEDAIVDGSRPITEAKPVEGKPGVFRFAVRTNSRDDHSVWEEDTRVRYAMMADERAVAQVPGSCVLTGTELVFHTSDNRPPSAHRIAMSRDSFGLHLFRGRVTIQGLQFRHFLLQSSSAGIGARLGDVIVEDCRFWNSNRAINIGVEGANVRVVRCRADDVAAGIKSLGTDLLVEDCHFFRKPGRFEVPEYSQDQSGVQVYHPGSRAEVRRTLCVGFALGLFFKCTPGRFIVEHNTVVATGDPKLSPYGIGCTSWFPESIFRHNIVTGYANAVLTGDKGVVPGAVVDANCLSSLAGDREVKSLAKCGAGLRNVSADPRFAAPDKDDFRLSSGSPAAKLATDGAPAGAFGFADGQPLRLLPPVKGALDVAAAPLLPPFAPLKPGFVKRAGPPRVWRVDPVNGRDELPAGTDRQPLRSLQLALNHANPGDRVVLRPGVYFGPHTLDHGGTKDAPIVIEASVPGGAVLDGLRLLDDANLALDNAPHVVIRGLEVRWFKLTGLQLAGSPNVRVEGCVFWNDTWSKGRSIGEGILGIKSPGLVVDHCLLYAMNRPIQLNDSPGFRITYTTVTMGLHHGVRFYRSAAGSVFRNNSVAYGGSYLMSVHPVEDIKAFDSDYNNWAANIRADSPRQPGPDEYTKPPAGDFFASKPSKAVMTDGHRDDGPDGARAGYYCTLREWQQKTGKDQHSIFKHPRYANPAKRDFRLLPDSPNIRAGEAGTNIGAGTVAR